MLFKKKRFICVWSCTCGHVFSLTGHFPLVPHRRLFDPGEYSMKYVLSSKPVGGVQQRGLGLLELELQVVVGCQYECWESNVDPMKE